MQGLRKALWAGLLLVVVPFLVASCATGSTIAAQGLFDGKRFLEAGAYDRAKASLGDALVYRKDAEVLAFLGTAEYMNGDLNSAARHLDEAMAANPYGFWYLRALGYKALVLLKEGQTEQGLRVLEEYVSFYGKRDPLMDIKDVSLMIAKGAVDLPELQRLIGEQVNWYERDVEQYRTNRTGFYDRFSPYR